MPRNQTIDNFFRGVSKPRNKALAEIFMQLRISEKIGRGVPRITKKYGKKAFDFTSSSLTVTIPFKIINNIVDITSNTNQLKRRAFSDREKEIIMIINDNPNITIPELAKDLKVSTTTIDKDLKKMRVDNIIERIGSNKAGYWKVIK